MLFVVAGVASVYAYDAHLDAQTTQLELLSWVPQPPTEVIADVERNPTRSSSNATNNTTRPTRTELIDSTSNPLNPPPHPGATASGTLPAPTGAIKGPQNLDPIGPPGGSRGSIGNGKTPVPIDISEPPPAPKPVPKPQQSTVLRVIEVLNSKALWLPKPNYPPLARNIRLQGSVIVQVLIDESGKVISAKVTSGHPLFTAEAQKAAMQARFSPTRIGDNAVKVSGVITYEFKLNN